MSWKIMFGEIHTKEDGVDDEGLPRFVRYSDIEVDLHDLSPNVFSKIARDVDVGLSYWGIFMYPKEYPEAVYPVICAAAAHAQVDPPPPPATMRDLPKLNAMFEEIQDIEEQPMQDGLPKAPSETESGSSSTSPDLPTTGSLTTPDDSE